MDNMQTNDLNESYVTIHFDSNETVTLNKSFLIEHSLYFEAMFCGQFMESRSGGQIKLKDINFSGFMKVIDSLIHNRIDFDCVKELLLVLETSQLLQFENIIKESITLIKDKYLFTVHAIYIFSLASRLGLKDLCNKARIYILYNFKTFLIQNRDGFFELNDDDLLSLLNDNGLNTKNEIDVYNLISDWCLKTDNYNIEHDMTIGCVRFNSMSKNQLKYCFLKTKNFNLQNTIKQYVINTNQSEETMGLLTRPMRSVPNALCAMKNENNGAYIYRWDWTLFKFTQFIKVEPLPTETTGYHVVVKDMNIFVMAGEISYGRGMWNETGWIYNMLTEKWTQIKQVHPTKRRHGIGCFCGNELHLLGGLTKNRLPNEEIERFRYDKDDNILYRANSYVYGLFTKKIDRNSYCCFEYKNQLAMITKCNNPTWFQLMTNLSEPPHFDWYSHSMNLNAIVICVLVYLDNVFVIAYNAKNTITLLSYCPNQRSCQQLKSFKTTYDPESTMCAFNVNKALVFGNNILEYYCIDTNVCKEYTTQMDSFHSDYFFSIPFY